MPGTEGLILASPSVTTRVLPGRGFDSSGQALHVEHFGGEGCRTELARVPVLAASQHVDVMIGMGGGKTIDTAKIVADRARIRVSIVSTIASTDAPCSGCAVVYSADGLGRTHDGVPAVSDVSACGRPPGTSRQTESITAVTAMQAALRVTAG